MKNRNGIYIIGVDHGYGNIKTANSCFPTGVESSDTEPTFKNDLLIYQGRYYQISVGHKEYAAEKVMDEDYYILTLAAIARELSREQITQANVFLAAGLPLSKKLGDKGREIQEMLSKYFMVDYDDAGSIGKRYRRQDEIGTPYCVTFDFDSAADGCVTVRDRDSMQQERIPMEQLEDYIAARIRF